MHPILIQSGPFTVPTYGALVAAGYLLGIWYVKSQLRWIPRMTEEKFWGMVYSCFFAAVLGGKLLFVALNVDLYWSGQMGFFSHFRYGFVFFGGLLGAMAAGVWIVRWLDIDYLATGDYVGTALAMGHAIGRVGCLGAGCCYGRPTELPWGVILGGHPASSTPEHLWGVPLHPVQLYEAAASAAIAGFLLYYVLPRIKKGRLRAGTGFLGYLALYALARFSVEFFRGDDRGGAFLALSVSQWISLAVLAASAELMRRRGIWSRR